MTELGKLPDTHTLSLSHTWRTVAGRESGTAAVWTFNGWVDKEGKLHVGQAPGGGGSFLDAPGHADMQERCTSYTQWRPAIACRIVTSRGSFAYQVPITGICTPG